MQPEAPPASARSSIALRARRQARANDPARQRRVMFDNARLAAEMLAPGGLERHYPPRISAEKLKAGGLSAREKRAIRDHGTHCITRARAVCSAAPRVAARGAARRRGTSRRPAARSTRSSSRSGDSGSDPEHHPAASRPADERVFLCPEVVA